MKANELRLNNWVNTPIEWGSKPAQVIRLETDKDGYQQTKPNNF